MCGFVAMLSLNGNKVDQSVVDRMTTTIKHRGPDDEGYYLSGPVGLGFRRLSILDVSPTGHQPMFSPDGQKVLVFNGEIYNYIELRKELQALGHRFKSSGDTEVLLHAYLEWGGECLEKLNGMWAFIIYDIRKGKLFGSRDRFGKKPLYRYRCGDYVIFASEIKAILSSGYYQGGPNWPLVSRFLLGENLSGIDQDNQSFYSGILQVPGGSAFELDLNGQSREWRFWSLSDCCANNSIMDPAKSYYERFEDAVRLRLRSDVPLGVFLSGGVDSTSVICTLDNINKKNANVSNSPITAISFHSPEFDESTYIADTIQQTGAELIRCEPDPRQLWNSLERLLFYQDEPVHSFAAVIFFELCRVASENGIKVMLIGGGADEYLAGDFSYFSNYWCTLLRSGHVREVWNEIGSYCVVHGDAQRSLFLRCLIHLLKAESRRLQVIRMLESWKRYKKLGTNSWFVPELSDHLQMDDPGYQKQTLDLALKRSIERYPLPIYLREDDRSTMAHSIEGRSPFLDYRLVSLAFQLPNNWKLRGPWNKYVLREAMYKRIPESVRSRPDKMGFSVPHREWFADLLYEPMLDLLGSQEFRERGIYKIDAIRRDLKLHREGKVNLTNRLFNLVQFEIWSKLEKDYRHLNPSRYQTSTISEVK